ncbi:PLP-dependent cysteine synthase family protein [Halorussus gelatinilyticus]|uniref:PLP-dependent cysteine synthase family protein n=1 Tax=Halorussus gelatinilyticus TaxID=2937524 RepID=A0A8U0IJA3_9EURY|nr:PLP-dependent cysteine synthase family protein [Halorussus gelatinilyticus]UPW00334.1 PLP-dependent cysteine synthase family protein [Halorussus gelatinilyticus]
MRDSILDVVGSPLVKVASPEGATVAAKVEGFNPGGSAKDRPAREMIAAAERAGEITPGDRLVEPTSGNTGIGLAVAAAARGYDLTIVMPASKSPERRKLLKAYGADLELVDGEMESARERADRLAEQEGVVQMGQFENPANAEAHYRTTAEEILEQVEGREIDAFVAGVGTGGTITGTASRLLEEFPEMEVVAVEPERNAVLTKELGEGSSDESDGGLSTGESGDDYQGMGPGFVSDLLDTDLLDSVETVALEDAEEEARRLAREEGILVGQSSGAASVAARRVADRLAEPELNCPEAPEELTDLLAEDGEADTAGGTGTGGAAPEIQPDGGALDGYDDCPLVVTVFPDSGERYLSTGMFD